MPVTSAASLSASRFCAAAVRKSAEECAQLCSCACTRNAPSRPAVAPGRLPACLDSDRMMGRNTPPARAVVLGMAGEMSASDSTRPYDSPSVLLPC